MEQMREKFVADLMMLTEKFDEGRIDECSRFLIQLNINQPGSLPPHIANNISPTSEFNSWSSHAIQRECEKMAWKLFKFASTINYFFSIPERVCSLLGFNGQSWKGG